MTSNPHLFTQAIRQLAKRTSQAVLRVSEVQTSQAAIKQRLQDIHQRCDSLQAKLVKARSGRY